MIFHERSDQLFWCNSPGNRIINLLVYVLRNVAGLSLKAESPDQARRQMQNGTKVCSTWEFINDTAVDMVTFGVSGLGLVVNLSIITTLT